ncbi:50S ribosomal protein L5 [Candidatus Vidania fulgoroideae]|uniref:50S ribosomal protein L5 n=1 Tax=Candidatus Vidania fulgoroideorum TaxID=881286 RepID=A0A975AEH9_9PROT|nr:50S ribosomal protein L5 [Candidatus Vidania fulgoroideae]
MTTLNTLKNIPTAQNPHTHSYILKVTINCSIGNKSNNYNYIQQLQYELTRITLQKPILIKTKQSIANFNIRKNTINSLKVTLRHKQALNFINKFINIAVPRIKDFRGFKTTTVDHAGNFNFGIKDYSIFPEIFLNPKTQILTGLNINITIKTPCRTGSFKLLTQLGFPFI